MTLTDPTCTDPHAGASFVAAAAAAPVPAAPAAAETDTLAVLRAATRRVAPLWPLDRFVAVNPYVGLADHTVDAAALRLARAAGAAGTLPASWYLAALDEGRLTLDDVDAALAAAPHAPAPDAAALVAKVRAEARRGAGAVETLPTVAGVAAAATGVDWSRLMAERVAAWAAAHFDEGQALWRSTSAGGAFGSWRLDAAIDRTPEVLGLAGFRSFVRSLPADPIAAARAAIAELAVADHALEAYLHALLLRVGGWAGHAARLAFEAEQAGAVDDTGVELLAVLLCVEQGLLRCAPAGDLRARWDVARHDLARLVASPMPASLAARRVLHEAFELASRRRLAALLSTPAPGAAVGAALGSDAGPAPVAPGAAPAEPQVQAVFCIDVRSEVFRRHLERLDGRVETLGFAGFFGFPVGWVPLGLETGDAHCPVLLQPSHQVHETLPDEASAERAAGTRRTRHAVRRAWKSFKMGAVSCFSFVGPVGLVYLPKLVTDSAGRTRPTAHPEHDALPRALGATVPAVADAIALDDRITLAANAVRAMSLADRLAPLVLLCGHGATTVNNPYDSGLSCGACGGHSGAANARVAAAVLNDPQVRAGLREQGIIVPGGTWFVAALHDTTTDDVTVFDADAVPASHRALLDQTVALLARAGEGTRAERATRLGADTSCADVSVRRRSRDWAQVRPEWGLAGCSAFVAAPRSRTAHLDLGGRSFLHSYDWKADDGFRVLELILAAPVVVASWINLQYFGSTVDNDLFGSGDKTLHNVVGRLGVLEGTGGDLRSGLPWQSVHDGERYQHEPLRLTVVVEAPADAIAGVLAAHPDVRRLFDNGWLHLWRLDDGRLADRYAGDLRWTPFDAA